jgi:CspA family cold shock protein
MKTGTVKFFNIDKGWGFIHEDDSDADYFIHASNLNGVVIKEGNVVQFDTQAGRGGRICAVNVHKI